jgi:hypothetical protein
MHDMRPDIDFVAARPMTPAARAAAELRAALEHERAKPAFHQRYRAGEARDPSAYNDHLMRYTIDVHAGYIKAEMRGRETGEETRTFVNALLASLRQHNTARVLISVRESRPVFKVEEWGFSDAIAKVLGTGLRVAFIADSKEVAMSQDYIGLLGRQKGFDFRSFAAEAEAVEWLRAAA